MPNDIEVRVVVTKDGEEVTEEWSPEAMSIATAPESEPESEE